MYIRAPNFSFPLPHTYPHLNFGKEELDNFKALPRW
jgi:hypothetical protein